MEALAPLAPQGDEVINFFPRPSLRESKLPGRESYLMDREIARNAASASQPSLKNAGGYKIMSSFDILKRDRRGKHILLAVVSDLETARLRLSQLAAATPGEYFVFDTRTHQIVAAMHHWK